MPKRRISQFQIYDIRVQGALDEKWFDWFNGSVISIEQVKTDPPVTRLVCRSEDQARLRGIINKLWDLNLALISVNCLETLGDENKGL